MTWVIRQAKLRTDSARIWRINATDTVQPTTQITICNMEPFFMDPILGLGPYTLHNPFKNFPADNDSDSSQTCGGGA